MKINATKARERLGVSKGKMAKLLAKGGELADAWEYSAINPREKLIDEDAVDALAQRYEAERKVKYSALAA